MVLFLIYHTELLVFAPLDRNDYTAFVLLLEMLFFLQPNIITNFYRIDNNLIVML